MKRSILAILTAVTMLTALWIPALADASSYPDVEKGSWYYEGADYVIRKGLMTGTGKNVFAPQAPVTRGQAAQILYAMAEKPETGRRVFEDVADGQWYTDAVSFCDQESMMRGYPDRTFHPNRVISREELVTVLYGASRYFEKDRTQKEPAASRLDVSGISTWAHYAMRWAVSNGLITGTDRGLEPRGTVTRAQMALIIRQFCEKLEKAEPERYEAPVLTMKSGEETWSVRGTIVTLEAPGESIQSTIISPTDSQILKGGRIPAGGETDLSWPSAPKKVEIRIWNVSDAGKTYAQPVTEETMTKNFSMTMEKDRIVEIEADWEQKDLTMEVVYRFVTA